MRRLRRTAWAVAWLAAVGLPTVQRAAAQFGFPASSPRFELDDTVQLDRADNAVLAQLQRVKDYLADRQWDAAIEALRSLMAGSQEKLIALTDSRYVGLRDYCNLRLAALPEEALRLYRGRVDPLAEQWYRQGAARHDRRLLKNVVEQALASSYGDDALLALGEMAFESGDFASARWYWERIVPVEEEEAAEGAGETAGGPGRVLWPGFPDTDLDLAAVRARLVLVSILEGATERAGEELAQLTRLHPDARGWLGGREVDYAEELRALLAASAAWPQPPPSGDWPTFAGNTRRNKTAPEEPDPAAVAWRLALPEIRLASLSTASLDVPPQSVAEDPAATLSYHPAFAGGLVFVNGRLKIRAVRLDSGKGAWGGPPDIYRDALEGVAGVDILAANTLGVPRYTVTVCRDRLYARMGSPLTSRSQRTDEPRQPSALVCLDLAAEGRSAWKITPEPGWAFEGTPVADRANVYVGLRRSDIRPQAYVACYDAQTGRQRWQRFVCGAETPARGMLNEVTSNLLTLERETLYYNTNLGAVAALSADDGQLRWLSLYPRAQRGTLLEPAAHWRRDLNPCVYDRGTLLVAPADSPRIFAFDAATGQLLWKSGTEVEGALHLLGTTADALIACGQRLYWIGLRGKDRGQLLHVWPEGPQKPGYGRGVLAGGAVLWPGRDEIYVFDAATAQPRRTIDLAARGLRGGNLTVAGDYLLVAGAKGLVALGRDQHAQPPGAIQPAVRRGISTPSAIAAGSGAAPPTTPIPSS